MLAQVVLSLEALPAHLTAVAQFRALVGPLMDHQVVRLGEPSLAVLAHKLALRTQLASEVAAVVLVYLHHGEHLDWTRGGRGYGARLRKQKITYQRSYLD